MPTKEQKQYEVELLKKWRNNGDQQALNELLDNYKPIIASWTQKLSTGVPGVDRTLLEGIVKKSIVESFKRFDFNRGIQLNTYVISRLPEVYREIQPLQNIAKIPAHRITQIQTYHQAYSTLQDELGREPTISELQDELGWSKREIQHMNLSLRRDLSESVGDVEPILSDPKIEFAFNTIYMSLQPKEKLMAEYLMGMAGKPRITDLNVIARKVKVPVSEVRKFKQKLIKDLRTSI